MSVLQPYKINIPDQKIEHLKQKLSLADFPHDAADFDGTSWAQGPPTNEIRRLAQFWQNKYDWRKTEAKLNLIPQYKVSVDVESLGVTYGIHYLHKKSPHKDAIPLLFLHGWPGSFIEVTKILDGLIEGQGEGEPCFHVIAPSLVDFGFSSRSTVSVNAPRDYNLVLTN